MIERISVNSINSSDRRHPEKRPQFTGALDLVVIPLQWFEQYPMLNVALLDVTTAIGPRTYEESKVNIFAGLEAFMRESSGLIVNCLIPSLIAWGIAKGIQGHIMGPKSKMADCWANEEIINLVTEYWEKAEGKTNREKVYNTFNDMINDFEGIDGKKTVRFEKLNLDKSIIEELRNGVFQEPPSFFERITAKRKAKKAARTERREYIEETPYSKIVREAHVVENIKIKGPDNKYLSQNLKSILDSTTKILRELTSGKEVADVKAFAKNSKKLLTAKSLLGLGVVIPLAISMQAFNRWITSKASGKKGAPIYKDFGKIERKELTPEEKSSLFKQKILSVGLMVSAAMLSMMKLPNMQMAKDIAQFKGVFPTMEQARLMFTVTAAGRMVASEDKHDLVRATIRDILSFFMFYFVGDYVAKGIATALQKTKKCIKQDIELINVLKEGPGDKANVFRKFWHWAKGTALKSSEEVHGPTPAATKYAKNLRSLCQAGNIIFSLIALGIVIPKIYINKTNRDHEKELKKMCINKNTADQHPHSPATIYKAA